MGTTLDDSQSAVTQPGPTPGWYPHPGDKVGFLWWDGDGWNDTRYRLIPEEDVPISLKSHKWDRVAFFSLGASIMGLVPVGLILGFVSRMRQSRNHRLRGDKIVTLSLVISLLWMVVGIGYLYNVQRQYDENDLYLSDQLSYLSEVVESAEEQDFKITSWGEQYMDSYKIGKSEVSLNDPTLRVSLIYYGEDDYCISIRRDEYPGRMIFFQDGTGILPLGTDCIKALNPQPLFA